MLSHNWDLLEKNRKVKHAKKVFLNKNVNKIVFYFVGGTVPGVGDFFSVLSFVP